MQAAAHKMKGVFLPFSNQLDKPPLMLTNLFQSIPSEVLIIAALLVGALLIHFVLCRVLRGAASAFAKRTQATWDDALIQHRVIERATHLLPGAFLLVVAPAVLDEELAQWFRKLTLAYVAIMVSLRSALL